ncbi:6-phospho-3-hexuloisomerase [uncultured Anaerococcus sp.]|uniref:6-phospho-3-hexuloisomerase n=1 Tax=uncultured Anaerococcus sp. TaxID=293428 RepID=UPI00288C0876|nr:6-phospho-3-hexuloisomerase [uncultured Anaerococcus sp.]
MVMDVKKNANIVVSEIESVFSKLDYNDVSKFIEYINEANKIILIGVGREGLSTRAFTMRLMHLGYNSYWIWDDTTPSIEEGDLLIATNGSGNIGHINYVIEKAKEHKANTVVVTGNPNGKAAKTCDHTLFLPASVYLGDAEVVESIQPMGNLFEQCLLIMYDLIIMELLKNSDITENEMSKHHRNLE